MISQKNDLNKMSMRFLRAEDKVKTNVVNAVTDIVGDSQHGAEALIQGVIMSTPSSLKPGKTNRYLSGNMHDQAGGITLFNSQGLPTIYFGWMKADIEHPNPDKGDSYFFLQEYGGAHPINGMSVSPMNALEKVSRDYLAMTGVTGSEGWASGTTPRLMPLVMQAIKAGLRGEEYRGSKLRF